MQESLSLSQAPVQAGPFYQVFCLTPGINSTQKVAANRQNRRRWLVARTAKRQINCQRGCNDRSVSGGPNMYYRLVAVDTTDKLPKTSWTLSLPATIGRGPEHAVLINHESISRTHCRLSLNADGALSVRDLNSMNGTYVGDEKISRSVLIPGDILRLGAISLRVEYDSETDEEPKPKPLTFDVSTTVPMKIDRLGRPRSAPTPPPKKWWQFW